MCLQTVINRERADLMRGAMLGAAIGAPFGFAIAGMLDAGVWPFVIGQSLLVFLLALGLRAHSNASPTTNCDREDTSRANGADRGYREVRALRESTRVSS